MNIEITNYQIEILDVHTEYNKTSQEDYNKLKDTLLSLSFITEVHLKAFDPTETYYCTVLNHRQFVISSEELITLACSNIKYKVVRKIQQNVNIARQLMDLAEKPIKLVTEGGTSGNTYNTKCEVHMPGMALSLYNELMLKEDCCTDEIQAELNSGWRLVAVCPQPAQRRPDYILGRYNPNIQIDGKAKRG